MSDWEREPETECELLGGHQDEHITHEEQGYRQYECEECGAEWWEEDS